MLQKRNRASPVAPVLGRRTESCCGRGDRRRDSRRVRRHLRPTPLRNRDLHCRSRAAVAGNDGARLPMVLAVTEPVGQVPISRRGQVRDPAERQSRLRARRGVRELQPRAPGLAFSTNTGSSAATTAATSSISSARCACPRSSRCTRCSSSPSQNQAAIVQKMASLRRALVVMSRGRQGSARQLVRRSAARRSGSSRTAFP